ncbi:toxin glutamine deamidase domain-containing protein [Microbispora sp. H13382]|uniref:toxin glutamine deamidase domain-containing protein n=1 Tax=Microbispora sp. H13382 TaxID=2729112 RepID=UPI002873CFE4|nr:toxin glutamine deamidase domain-containing protein [Microbispora sp. H13382]
MNQERARRHARWRLPSGVYNPVVSADGRRWRDYEQAADAPAPSLEDRRLDVRIAALPLGIDTMTDTITMPVVPAARNGEIGGRGGHGPGTPTGRRGGPPDLREAVPVATPADAGTGDDEDGRGPEDAEDHADVEASEDDRDDRDARDAADARDAPDARDAQRPENGGNVERALDDGEATGEPAAETTAGEISGEAVGEAVGGTADVTTDGAPSTSGEPGPGDAGPDPGEPGSHVSTREEPGSDARVREDSGSRAFARDESVSHARAWEDSGSREPGPGEPGLREPGDLAHAEEPPAAEPEANHDGADVAGHEDATEDTTEDATGDAAADPAGQDEWRAETAPAPRIPAAQTGDEPAPEAGRSEWREEASGGAADDGPETGELADADDFWAAVLRDDTECDWLDGPGRPRRLEETRPYGRPGGLAEADPDGQVSLAQAVSGRFPDPRGTWIRLINAEGPTEDAFRSNNAVDCALSVMSTWHGEPAVAARRQPEYDGSGRPLLTGETGGVARAEEWLGHRFEYVGHGRRAYVAVAQRLIFGGHGAAAVLITRWAGGGSHAWNAVNCRGEVLWIDAQRGHMAVEPPYEDVTGVFAVVIDRQGRRL